MQNHVLDYLEKTALEKAEIPYQWMAFQRGYPVVDVVCFEFAVFATHPRRKGILQVAFSKAVITPQRRSKRVPQGSPQVFRRP